MVQHWPDGTIPSFAAPSYWQTVNPVFEAFALLPYFLVPAAAAAAVATKIEKKLLNLITTSTTSNQFI